MSRIVCKFGGTSLADAARIQRAAKIVQSDPSRRWIVLSAPGKRDSSDVKATDLLYEMIGEGKINRSIFSRIFQRYAAIRDVLAPDFDLEAEFAELYRHDARDTDYFVSRGEYLIARLFAAATGWSFVDAADLLFFEESGQIDRAASERACVEALLPLRRAVIPGFYGRNAEGGIRVFPRGGSDVSGAWLAAFLHADLYENWTDVSGLYSADPALVDLPVQLPRVPYSRAEAILRAGAAVLDPNAIAPLREAGIECQIRSTFAPESASTRICACPDCDFPCVTGRRGDCGTASISVFGMNSAQIPVIQREIQPLHIIHMRECVQIIVPNEKYVESLRRIHEILFDRDGA